MTEYRRSNRLHGVCYDIRGPVMRAANKLEAEGHHILKLNIGNPAPFGFDTPSDILKDVIHQLPTMQGYSEANGIYPARVAVMQYYQKKGLHDVSTDRIWIGNGVSELILLGLQALVEAGDEILVPAPDYPLWTAAVKLAGGQPVHYICDENEDWQPSSQDIERKITEKTKALVIINPNNPTGAVYTQECLKRLVDIARKHDLILISDEIYDKILFDGHRHTCIASMANDILCLTLGGLSKNYRIAGFRMGWLTMTGPHQRAQDLIVGIDMLASMRMCANVPCQAAIQTALGGYQSIESLIETGGRLEKQRRIAAQHINEIDGLSCMVPKGAMYCFVKVDAEKFNILDDERMVLDLLHATHILVVHGRAFNLSDGCYFRIVFLPEVDTLVSAIQSIAEFFQHYQQT